MRHFHQPAGFTKACFFRARIWMPNRAARPAGMSLGSRWCRGKRAKEKSEARKADHEFSGAEYVRNGPPGPVLTLLRYVPPTTGLVVGARGKLSRSAKQFAPECAQEG